MKVAKEVGDDRLIIWVDDDLIQWRDDSKNRMQYFESLICLTRNEYRD